MSRVANQRMAFVKEACRFILQKLQVTDLESYLDSQPEVAIETDVTLSRWEIISLKFRFFKRC